MRFLLGYGSCGIASGADFVLEGLNEILLNRNLSPLEKDIEFVKMVAKKNVKNNRSIGMKSKLALVSIINKNQPIKDIVLELIGYMNVNDLSK